MEQADEVGARADDEAVVGEGRVERARAAEPLALLEHEHREAAAGEIGRGSEPVVAPADDHDVPLASRQLGHRRRKTDAPEHRERVHGRQRNRTYPSHTAGSWALVHPSRTLRG